MGLSLCPLTWSFGAAEKVAGAAVTATTLAGAGQRAERCHGKDGPRESWPDWKQSRASDRTQPPDHFRAVWAELLEGSVARRLAVTRMDAAVSLRGGSAAFLRLCGILVFCPHLEGTGRGRDAPGREGRCPLPTPPVRPGFALDTGSDSLAQGGPPSTCLHQSPSRRGRSAQGWGGTQQMTPVQAAMGGGWGWRPREEGALAGAPGTGGPAPKEAEASTTWGRRCGQGGKGWQWQDLPL